MKLTLHKHSFFFCFFPMWHTVQGNSHPDRGISEDLCQLAS